jgi:hypothetical protein
VPPNDIELVFSLAAEMLVAWLWIVRTGFDSVRQEFHYPKQDAAPVGRSIICERHLTGCIVSTQDRVQGYAGRQDYLGRWFAALGNLGIHP